MITYLYALLGPTPAADALVDVLASGGSSQEPLRVIEASGLRAVVGDLGCPPTVTPAALRAHDEVARRLADVCPSLLPARFGQGFPDDAACRARLAQAAGPLRDALALVDGCVQVSLRLFGIRQPTVAASGAAAESGASVEADASLGPGARHLRKLAGAARARATAPELAPLRPLLDPLVRAERVRRASGGRACASAAAGASGGAGTTLLVSIYHLVPREALPRYTEHLTQAAPALAPLQLTASGPWPAYAFAPEPLDALAPEVQ